MRCHPYIQNNVRLCICGTARVDYMNGGAEIVNQREPCILRGVTNASSTGIRRNVSVTNSTLRMTVTALEAGGSVPLLGNPFFCTPRVVRSSCTGECPRNTAITRPNSVRSNIDWQILQLGGVLEIEMPIDHPPDWLGADACRAPLALEPIQRSSKQHSIFPC